MFLHIYTQERNQEPSVGLCQYGRRTGLFNASYNIRLRFRERRLGCHLLSETPSGSTRNQRGEDEAHLQVLAKGRKDSFAQVCFAERDGDHQTSRIGPGHLLQVNSLAKSFCSVWLSKST